MAKKAKKRVKKAPKRAARRPAARKARPKARPKARRKAKAKTRTRARPAVATQRTPPSSLDLNRTATAARSGHIAIGENQRRHNKMAAVTGGDVDVDMEHAYFSGDEGPGGDNPSPDQNDVDELGHAMGVEYGSAEELKGSDKVAERDKHRWESE